MFLKVLILGASGMLGRGLLSVLGSAPDIEVAATYRKAPSQVHADAVITDCDILNEDDLSRAFEQARPDVVINAVGVVKQLAAAEDPLRTVPINTLLPHRLARLTRLCGARLIHISTDCVFSGKTGGYTESDTPDATDLYGLSKLLGEVSESPNAITLRTSIIGREQGSSNGLVEWFLGASTPVKGYRRAVFSGFPTVVLARIIYERIIPQPQLHGLYHLSSAAIDKYTLLKLISDVYDHNIEISPSDDLVIDRSLNSDRFRQATGFQPESWPDMIREMHSHQG
jgi:dTDP-4-dehydrorhamnose reductase